MDTLSNKLSIVNENDKNDHNNYNDKGNNYNFNASNEWWISDMYSNYGYMNYDGVQEISDEMEYVVH